MGRLQSMLAMYALAVAANNHQGSSKYSRLLETTETEQEKAARLERSKIKQMKQKGLTEFKYSGGSVWALNQKTADKKARKAKII